MYITYEWVKFQMGYISSNACIVGHFQTKDSFSFSLLSALFKISHSLQNVSGSLLDEY